MFYCYNSGLMEDPFIIGSLPRFSQPEIYRTFMTYARSFTMRFLAIGTLIFCCCQNLIAQTTTWIDTTTLTYISKWDTASNSWYNTGRRLATYGLDGEDIDYLVQDGDTISNVWLNYISFTKTDTANKVDLLYKYWDDINAEWTDFNSRKVSNTYDSLGNVIDFSWLNNWDSLAVNWDTLWHYMYHINYNNDSTISSSVTYGYDVSWKKKDSIFNEYFQGWKIGHHYLYDDLNNSWNYSSKDSLTRISDVEKQYFGDISSNFYWRTYYRVEYNDNGDILEHIKHLKDTVSNNWVYCSKRNSTYDIDNHLVDLILANWDITSNTWINYLRETLHNGINTSLKELKFAEFKVYPIQHMTYQILYLI